ncbi:MAG: AI-2E family transporter [Candidatus Latescibacteria bacterium]|nr:AI-2E family transporter [Candidatus Latescibacterota bacterium]MCK5381420.1 AI-2E family transporter [Candidatus Latescibacterota bacterium]MCK5525990.1 AI-2E family transporter [Candidatus Latescibacterota bacterium]MCK5732965.1 AI-2E family transporter [Candidatus Latescibacterota bacterium]
MNVNIQDRIVLGGKLLIGLLVLIVTAWILYALRGILLPFGLSFLLAYVLNPVANRLEGAGISRTGAIGLIYLVVLLTLALGIVFLVPVIRAELDGLSTNFPEYLDKIEYTMDTWENKLKSYIPMLENYDLTGEVAKRGKSAAENIVKQAPGMISNVVTIFTFLIIVPFATFFLMKDGRSMKTALIRLVPNRYFEMTLNLLWKMDRPLGGYIRGQLTDASIIGLLAITGLSIIGLKYFMVIGAIAGITNMVPYLGPAVGFVLASVIALITDGSMAMVLKVAIVFACVQLSDNILVQPMVMSRSVRLHPLAIMVVVLIGSQLMGILGMVLAVPLTGVIKVTVETLRENLRGYAGGDLKSA